MKDSDTFRPCDEISHIKTLMLKSELHFVHLKKLFLFLALYSIIEKALLALFRYHFYSEKFQTGELLRDVFFNSIAECIWKVIALLPILLYLSVICRKLKTNNFGITLWLFNLIKFTLVFCGSILPIASVALTNTKEPADLFSVLTCALVILLCGVVSDNKRLKTFSYFYISVPIAVLTVMGLVLTYLQYIDCTDISITFVNIFSYTKTLSYVLYPPIGYTVLFVFMRKKAKENFKNEL